MEYAASIGGLGLDKDKSYTRDEVYGMRSNISVICQKMTVTVL